MRKIWVKWMLRVRKHPKYNNNSEFKKEKTMRLGEMDAKGKKIPKI